MAFAAGRGIANLAFDISMQGSLLLLFGGTAICLVTALSSGLWISTAVETQQQAMFVTYKVSLTQRGATGLSAMWTAPSCGAPGALRAALWAAKRGANRPRRRCRPGLPLGAVPSAGQRHESAFFVDLMEECRCPAPEDGQAAPRSGCWRLGLRRRLSNVNRQFGACRHFDRRAPNRRSEWRNLHRSRVNGLFPPPLSTNEEVGGSEDPLRNPQTED